MKKYFKGLIFFLSICFFSEFFLAIYTRVDSGKWMSSNSLNSKFFTNILGQKTTPCVWGDSLQLHPYTGYSYIKLGTECTASVHNYGFKGSQVPIEYDPNYYTILVLGGSVAEQIGGHLEHNLNQTKLEMYLNSNYVSPTKKPFRVINFSLAGSAQPVASIAANLFVDRADELISIEGYNEATQIQINKLIESPTYVWEELAAIKEAPLTYYNLKFSMTLTRRILQNEFLNHSYIVHYFLKLIIVQSSKKFESFKKNSNPFRKVENSVPIESRSHLFLKSYAKYLQNTNAIAKYHKKKFTLFLQPYPLSYKTLTDEEKSVVYDLKILPEDIKTTYRYLENSLNDIQIENLEKVFIDEKQTVYIDHIHTNPAGVQKLAEEISLRLAQNGRWQKKWNY